MKRPLILIAAATAAVAFAAAPGALANGGDNTAVAVNTHDGQSVYRFAFKVLRVNRDIVDQSNAAVAAASCTDCQTTAIALQVLLITDTASTVTPTNLAFALNVECSECLTAALAYQWVFSVGDPVLAHFTAEGNRRLAAVRVAAQQLRREELTIAELQARVTVLANEVDDVLRTELVAR